MKFKSLITNLSLCSTIAISALITPASAQDIYLENKISPDTDVNYGRFGHAIASDDGMVVVSTQAERKVFVYDIATGALISTLVHDPSTFDAFFGTSVAIDNGLVIVGTHKGYDAVTQVRGGSAYVFDATTGNQVSRFQPAGGGIHNGEFGNSVDIDNGIAVVGAHQEHRNGLNYTGAAYIHDANTGELLLELQPDVIDRLAYFGTEVAIENGIVAVSALYNDVTSPHDPLPFLYNYVYLFDAATGNQITRLQANKWASGGFGTTLDINNGTLAVGAPQISDEAYLSGAVFCYDAATGNHITTILPEDPSEFLYFGQKISLEDGRLAVGASNSVYLFNAVNQNQIAKLLPNDGKDNDRFGTAISIEENVVFIGAQDYDGDEVNSGVVYTFDTSELCPADLTGDSTLDFFDISAFLTAYAAQDPIADFNDDTLFDFFDISAFLTAYSAGCP